MRVRKRRRMFFKSLIRIPRTNINDINKMIGGYPGTWHPNNITPANSSAHLIQPYISTMPQQAQLNQQVMPQPPDLSTPKITSNPNLTVQGFNPAINAQVAQQQAMAAQAAGSVPPQNIGT